eukprot:TRINITY_DN2321_c0_g1_i3.p1 TRINITY_DN2321_c0_g1~~TRINITY_DN2321_c0_g1_i3.p1  ORF type:complete len:168 (+),score=15.32 TRINITY_DN2321_c0_g1_i3:98-601(+)
MRAALSNVWHVIKRSAGLVPVVILFNDGVASMSKVEGRSMQPTLNPQGYAMEDFVLLDKLTMRYMDYSRGDVVILRAPDEPKQCLVKRLIAMEGDWITVPGTFDVKQVPKGHCWVEGDNLQLSCDSKQFGPVPIALLEGRVSHVIWPPTRIGPVEKKLPEGRVIMRR